MVSGKVANFHCKRGVTGTLAPSRRIKRPGLTRRRFEKEPEAEVRVLSLQSKMRVLRVSSGRRAQSVGCVMKEERTVKVWSGTIKPVYYKARTLVDAEVEVADVGNFLGLWCSWLARLPVTQEVTSSSLVNPVIKCCRITVT